MGVLSQISALKLQTWYSIAGNYSVAGHRVLGFHKPFRDGHKKSSDEALFKFLVENYIHLLYDNGTFKACHNGSILCEIDVYAERDYPFDALEDALNESSLLHEAIISLHESLSPDLYAQLMGILRKM